MADLKNSRDQSRLEKAAREDGSAWVHYEAEAEAVRKKTARLKALRIAKEAADKSAAVEKGAVPKKQPQEERGPPNQPETPCHRQRRRRINQKAGGATENARKATLEAVLAEHV